VGGGGAPAPQRPWTYDFFMPQTLNFLNFSAPPLKSNPGSATANVILVYSGGQLL